MGFFTGFNDLLEQLDSDADNFVTEYLERKREDYVTILLGMIFKLEIGESTRTSKQPNVLKKAVWLIVR